MLTESQVQNSFRKLMNGERNAEVFEKIELLLEELRPQSPLRHRLAQELEEVRKLAGVEG